MKKVKATIYNNDSRIIDLYKTGMHETILIIFYQYLKDVYPIILSMYTDRVRGKII